MLTLEVVHRAAAVDGRAEVEKGAEGLDSRADGKGNVIDELVEPVYERASEGPRSTRLEAIRVLSEAGMSSHLSKLQELMAKRDEAEAQMVGFLEELGYAD